MRQVQTGAHPRRSNPAAFNGACVRPKQLEEEHARLKKLVSERTEVIKEIAAKMVAVPVRREQVADATSSQAVAIQIVPAAGVALGNWLRSRKASKDADAPLLERGGVGAR